MIENERQRIQQELSEINNLEHELNAQELKMENLGLKIQNQEKLNQTYQHRFEIAQNSIQKHVEDKYLQVNESSTEQNIDQIIKSCLE